MLSGPAPAMSPGPTASARPGNRRSAVRLRPQSRTPGRVFIADVCKTLFGELHNATTEGLGVLLTHPVGRGAQVCIDLTVEAGPGQRVSLELLGEVMHATEQPCGRWLVGCRLMAPLRKSQLAVLLAPEGEEAEGNPTLPMTKGPRTGAAAGHGG